MMNASVRSYWAPCTGIDAFSCNKMGHLVCMFVRRIRLYFNVPTAK